MSESAVFSSFARVTGSSARSAAASAATFALQYFALLWSPPLFGQLQIRRLPDGSTALRRTRGGTRRSYRQVSTERHRERLVVGRRLDPGSSTMSWIAANDVARRVLPVFHSNLNESFVPLHTKIPSLPFLQPCDVRICCAFVVVAPLLEVGDVLVRVRCVDQVLQHRQTRGELAEARSRAPAGSSRRSGPGGHTPAWRADSHPQHLPARPRSARRSYRGSPCTRAPRRSGAERARHSAADSPRRPHRCGWPEPPCSDRR